MKSQKKRSSRLVDTSRAAAKGGELWLKCAKLGLLDRLLIQTALQQLLVNPHDRNCSEFILSEIRKADVRDILHPDAFRKSSPDVHGVVDGPIRLGTILHSGLPWGITPEMALRHIAIFGQTGSGKSVTLTTLIRSLLASLSGPPVVIIPDRKNEFAGLARVLGIPYFHPADFPDHHFTPPGANCEALYFNLVSEITAMSIGLHQQGQSTLHREVSILSEQCKREGRRYPSTRDLARFILHRAESARASTRDNLLRVGMHLQSFADYSRFFTSSEPARDWDTLMKVGCVINLAGLPVNFQFYEIALTLAKILLYRVANNLRSDQLKILIPLDECQPIFGAGQSRSLAGLMDSFVQARAFGIGVIGCSQTTNLCHEFLANTSIKVCLTLGHGLDFARFGSAVGLDTDALQQMRSFTRPGLAVVKDPRWPTPFPVQITRGDNFAADMTADELSSLSKYNREKYFGRANEDAKADIHSHPTTALSGVQRREVDSSPTVNASAANPTDQTVNLSKPATAAQNLLRILRTQATYPIPFLFRAEAASLAGVTGGATVHQAEQYGLDNDLIAKHDLPFARTHKCLWEITDAGYRLLEKPKPTWPSKGGYVHTAVVHRVAHTLKKQGFEIKIECLRPNGKLVDLCATRPGKTIYIEVCASWPVIPKETSNVEKDTGGEPLPDKIIIAVTERRMRKALKGPVDELRRRPGLPIEVSVELAGDLIGPLEAK